MAEGEKVNEIEFYLEEIDRKIIRLWNTCRSAAVIADTLDIDIEYVQAVIDEPQNYKEGKWTREKKHRKPIIRQWL